MSCTTLLVGKNASYDGSTMIARNDDSGAFTPKKFIVISSKEQKRKYKTVISHLEIDLPDHPMSYTAMPNAVKGKGIWAASGINEENIAMTATETITSNPRVLGADPLVEYDQENKCFVQQILWQISGKFCCLSIIQRAFLYDIRR